MTLKEFFKLLKDVPYKWGIGQSPNSIIRGTHGDSYACPLCALANHLSDDNPEYALEGFKAGKILGLSTKDISLILLAADGDYVHHTHTRKDILQARETLIETLNPKIGIYS